jgi:RimJ/RimL family protein N-acetyltransferase
MIEVRESRPDELQHFCELDQDPDAREHINVSTLLQHQQEFARADIVYLSIYANAELAGYFILALEADPGSVEFRRIVVANKGAGTGQAAILVMEAYCRDRLDCQRIWLDVFESNTRGRHVYEKLGYHLFDAGELRGKKLLYLQKNIAANPDIAG